MRIGHLKEQNQCLLSHRFYCEICGNCFHHSQVAPFDLKYEKYFQEQKQSDPIIPEQAYHPISVLCPERYFQILLSCEKLTSVSYTSNLLEQMYGCQKHIMFSLKWILNLQDLLRSQSLETVPVCIVLQYYPHNNTVCIHMCDEYLKSIDSGVCHKPWSILWLIVQVCSLTKEYRVFQFLPKISISEKFESILLTILPRISILLLWNDGRQCMELILVELLSRLVCQLTISFYTFVGMTLHVIGPRRNTQIFRAWYFFSCSCGNSGFKHGSVISLLVSHCLWVHPRKTWSRTDVGSPKSTFHIGSRFCFFPANFMSSTYTDKNNPFSRWTKRHSQFGIFSQPCFNRIFSNCLSHNGPAKGWPCRFRSRGTTASSMLDHDFGHLCFGRRIQISGHSDFGIFNNVGAFSIFYLGISRYCVCCLSCASWQSGFDIHDFCCHLWCWWPLFSEYCIWAWIILHNVTSEHNSTFVVLKSWFQLRILEMTKIQ